MEVLLNRPTCVSLVVLLALPTACASYTGDCHPRLRGTWEYRQVAGDGYDVEGERLELRCSGDTVQGLYFGLEREGEHGLFYTLVAVTNLKVGPKGELSFTVPERDLFRERPRTLQEVAQKRPTSQGVTRDELYLRGRVAQERMTLTCTSKGHSCPEDLMVFHRAKGSPRG